MEYKIITELSLISLEEKVKQYVAQGYEAQGGIIEDKNYMDAGPAGIIESGKKYSQAVFKK